MAFRSDITFNFEESPRVATVDAPSVEVSVQDLHDTMTDTEDSILGHQFDNLILSAGKEDLGGGVLVGITAELQNIQVTFEDRSFVWDTASVTTPDANGVLLTDSASTFVTDLVTRGDLVVNSTDGSHATVLQVVSETQLDTQPLAGGIDNQYDTSDAINIFNIYRCTVSGGNTVAIDDVGAELDPVLQSFGTQIKVASSSSATLSEQEDIQYASFNSFVHVDTTTGVAGTAYPAGNEANPSNNLTDAAAIDAERGFNAYDIRKSLTLSNEASWEDKTFVGHSIIDTVITVGVLADVTKAVFFTCSIEGSLGATTLLKDCFLGETNPLTNVRGVIEDCSIGPSPLTLGGSLPEVVRFVDCRGAGLELAPPTLNLAGDGPEVDIQGYIGQLNIANKTGEANLEVSINGKLTLDPTVTNGIVVVNGTGTLIDNSGPGCLVVDNMIQGAQLRELFVTEGLDVNNPFTKTPSVGSSADGQVVLQYNQQQSLMNYGDSVTKVTTRSADAAITFRIPLVSDLVEAITNVTPTFTRASAATYVHLSTGLITSASVDATRFETSGLLIEEARTNEALWSEEIDNAAWVAASAGTGITPTKTADFANGPDGTSTADRIQCDLNGGTTGGDESIVDQVFSGLANPHDIAASIWLKSNTGSDHDIWMDTGLGTINDVKTVTPAWQRFSVAGNLSGFTIDRIRIGLIGGFTDDTCDILVSSGQVEIDLFSSSYLVTTSGSTARSADFLSYNNDTVLLDSEGSITAEITPEFNSDDANNAVILNIADQLVGPLYILNDTTQKVAIGDGTNVASLDPTFVSGQTVKVGVRWSTTANQIQVVANGTAGATAAYDGSFTRTAGTLYIGSDSTGNHFNGNIKNVVVYNSDRGEDQLKVDTG